MRATPKPMKRDVDRSKMTATWLTVTRYSLIRSRQIDLVSGLTFAAVFEGVACLLRTIALHSPRAVASTLPVLNGIANSHAAVTVLDTPVSEPVIPAESEVTRLARDIAAGHVRATVADIHRHLRCSQAKATSLRRQLVAHTRSP
jgi:hypothetical protein